MINGSAYNQEILKHKELGAGHLLGAHNEHRCPTLISFGVAEDESDDLTRFTCPLTTPRDTTRREAFTRTSYQICTRM
jgi:hypothetical protein